MDSDSVTPLLDQVQRLLRELKPQSPPEDRLRTLRQIGGLLAEADAALHVQPVGVARMVSGAGSVPMQ